MLAFSFPELREGIANKQNAKSELTAIIEPGLDRSDDAVAFALAVMERSNISVATTAELLTFAERARRELKA